MGVLQKIRGWLGQAERGVEDIAEGGTAVATAPPGSEGDEERETSTNAQVEGAAGQPYE